MYERIYNYIGEDITDKRICLLDDSYGFVDEKNIPHIKWGTENEKCDKNGFDKKFRPVKGSDEYVINDYVIPKGTMICRYGSPRGRFTTIKGTAYESLSLPYVKETIEYHLYRVSEDLKVECRVSKGAVAPKFSSPGGAIQFMHYQPIKFECEQGKLKEEKSWRQENI